MRFATLVCAALVAAPALHAQADPIAGDCEDGTASAELDAADVRAELFNTGVLFFNGGDGQYEVPNGSGLISVFAASYWLGGTVGGEVRVAGATYTQGGPGYEFWPGPLGPGGAAPTRASCAAADRIWRVTVDDVIAYNVSGEATPDLAEWPVALGAPVLDGDGVAGNYDLAAGDRPAILGGETAWWVMNDRGGLHTSLGAQRIGARSRPGPPLGIELRVTAFSFPEAYTLRRYGPPAVVASADLALQTFYRVEVRNGNTEDAIDDLSFAYWTDTDLGNFGDDYFGSDSLLALAYTYNSDDLDEGSTGYGDRPPALGSTFLNAPLAGALYYTGASNIGSPNGSQETYNYLDGRLRNGDLRTEGFDGTDPDQPPTPFMFSGRPPAYWSEFDSDPAPGLQPNAPGDRRFLSYVRRDRLGPGETWTLDLAMVWAQAETGGALASLEKMLRQTGRTRDLYQNVGLFTPDARLRTLLPPEAEAEPEPAFPDRLALGQRPRPHPVAAASVLDVRVPETAEATLDVFDALGRLVAELPLVAGQETVALGALGLAPGAYLARLRADGQAGSRVVQFIVTR